jgi:CRP/FNR family transcriptional regulator, cyclic AMP receptor protein
VGAVAVIDADPDLAEGLPEAEREAAGRRLVAPTFELQAGPWYPEHHGALSGHGVLGVLVLDGLLSRSLTLEGRATGELLGSGDVLRPWDAEERPPGVVCEVAWSVHSPARLALLDRRFVVAAAHWPSVLEELARRLVRRSRALSLQLALGQVPRIEGRLLLMFWRLAERWGRVTPDGILIPLRLTHETLAALVAARRPSVTSALGRLADAELLERRDGGWLLHRAAADHLPEFLAARDAADRERTIKPVSTPAASGWPAR